MAVLVTAQVENQTEEIYDRMLLVLAGAIRQAPGFVMHGAYRAENGDWRVLEVWQSKSQADQFFARHVAPQLPPGIRPKRSVVPLHSMVVPLAQAAHA